MDLLARIFAGIGALFGLFMGANFLLNPLKSGADFFLAPNGVPGLAVLRADMGAFFLVSGILAAAAVWKRNPTLLIAPALLYATAILGRTISLAVDGVTPGAFLPMAVEAMLVAIFLFAHRTFSTKG